MPRGAGSPRLELKTDATVLVGNRYNDDMYEYRHVQLPKQMLKAIPKEYFDGSRGTLKLLWEDEWRGLGITQVSDTQCGASVGSKTRPVLCAHRRLSFLENSGR